MKIYLKESIFVRVNYFSKADLLLIESEKKYILNTGNEYGSHKNGSKNLYLF